MSQVVVRLRNEANTATTSELSGAFGVSFQVRRNEPGTGKFSLGKNDPDRALVTRGSVVRFATNGTGRFIARVKSENVVEVSEGDEGIEAVEFECDGILADLEPTAAQLDEAFGGLQADLVPSLDERIWNWASNEYDEVTAGWGLANVIALQGWESPFYTGQPAGWTDPGCAFVWGTPGDDDDAPAGTCLFKERVVVGAGKKFLDWSCDNVGALYLNGKKVQDGNDFRKKQTYEFTTTGGVLVIAFEVTNAADDGPPGGNPGGLIASMRVDSPEGGVLWRSTATMRCLSYPVSYPQIPVGKVLRDIRDGNGITNPHWTMNFTDTADTNSVAWPTVPEFSARLYDDSLIDVIKAMSETWIDVRVAPGDGKVLNAYVKPYGSTSSLSLVTGYSTAGEANPDLVNITDLDWDIEWSKFDRLAVRWADGWIDLGGPLGNRWATLRIEQVNSATVATSIGNQMLALNSVDQYSASFRYLPLAGDGSDEPFEAFNLFDTLNVPGPNNHNSTTAQRVQSITCTADEDGEAEWVVQVGSPIADEIERLERAIRRIGPGGLTGNTNVSSASAGKAPYNAANRYRLSSPSSGAPAHCIASAPNAATGVSVAPNLFVGKVNALRLIGDGASGTSTVTVSDGVTTWELSGTGEGLVDHAYLTNKTWTTSTMLTVTITAVGHTNLHVYADTAEV